MSVTPDPTPGAARGAFRLPDATRLGAVHLQVADLDRSLAFYEGLLGLRVLARDAGVATLGAQAGGDADGAPLLALRERAGARPMTARGRLGLYHTAFLLPDRAALGRFVRHLGERGVRAGAGDHLVSEAFYLTDPDGLGVEVYADRPRSAWTRGEDGEIAMATDPVDVPGLLGAAGDAPWRGAPAGTTVGHVHLHVGDLDRGGAFYGDALGFDRSATRYPGALFLAAGGYHHHVGTNVWAGRGATPPADDDARLLEWTVELPDAESLAAAAASLARGGHPVDETSDAGGLTAVLSRDPWGTAVRLRLTPGAPPGRRAEGGGAGDA